MIYLLKIVIFHSYVKEPEGKHKNPSFSQVAQIPKE